jgi:hypothetical protein
VEAVIRQLPGDTPAEDISNERISGTGLKCHSVWQMTATWRKPQGGLQTFNIPLLLVTHSWNEKTLEIFKLTDLNHIIIKVEAYSAQGGLMQCYNCQSLATSGPTASNLLAVCDAGVATSARNALRRPTSTQTPAAATSHWQRGKPPSLKFLRLQPCERRIIPQEGTENIHDEDSSNPYN